MSNIPTATIRAKANAKYTCRECGSTELVQAHHQIPKDHSTIICLCAECHSTKHPNIPKALFFTKAHQPFWNNKSAASLARELGCHSRTIIRIARKLQITSGHLAADGERRIRELARQPAIQRQYRLHLLKYGHAKAQTPSALHCLRCGHKWIPRIELIRICPKCKSPYWDTPKINNSCNSQQEEK